MSEETDQEQDSKGDLYHDEMTMHKVHEALMRAGVISAEMRVRCVNEMQNVGILFRERGKF